MSYFVSGCCFRNWSLLPELSFLLLVKFTASLQPTESSILYSALIVSILSQTGGPGGPAKKTQFCNLLKGSWHHYCEKYVRKKYEYPPNKYL